MTQLNWQKIAAENPKAFEAFRQYREPKDSNESTMYAISGNRNFETWVGYLEAFFDSQGIIMIVSIYVFPDEWEWDIEVLAEEEGYQGNIHSTRQEAQIEGFQKAFSLLEERLKGG
jgi:hypothetical protein